MVALAGGIGATTALPAPLVLAGFAAVAAGAGAATRLATGWAALAGVAPLLTFVDELAFTGAGTFERLGLTGEQPRPGRGAHRRRPPPSVLGVVGRRRHDAGLVLLGVALGAVGCHRLVERRRSPTAAPRWSAWPPIFLLVRAGRLRHPPTTTSGAIPAGIVAQVVEWFAGHRAPSPPLLPILLAPAFDAHRRTETALATLVLGAGWLVADRRRGSRGLRARGRRHRDLRRVGRRLRHRVRPDARRHPHRASPALAVLSGHRAGSAVAVLAAVLGTRRGRSTSTADARRRRRRRQPRSSPRPRCVAPRCPAADDRAADVAEQWAWVLSAVALVPGAIAMGALHRARPARSSPG